MEGIKLSNQENTIMLRKENYKHLGILDADVIRQAETKEKKCI